MNLLDKILAAFTNQKFESVISQIENYKNIDGLLTDNEAFGLFSVAKKIKNGAKVVEIGSWKGKSTYCIAMGLKSGSIFCVDPFNADGESGSKEIYESKKGEIGLLQQFEKNLSSISPSISIQALKGYSKEFVGAVKNIDFLFIDGDHSIEGCKFDFVNFATDLNVGGYLAFHDYYADRKELGPTWVIDNMVLNNPDYLFFGQYDSLYVFKRVK